MAELDTRRPGQTEPHRGPPMPAMVDYAVTLDEAQGRGGTSLGLRIARSLKRHIRPRADSLPGFDPAAYLAVNPDLAHAKIEPVWHYATFGWLEERPLRDNLGTRAYLSAEPRARGHVLDIYASRAARAGRPFTGASRRERAQQPGVLVVGYVEANLGLGESTRGLARTLAANDVPFALYPYNTSVEDRYVGPFMPERYDRPGRYDVTLFEANGDQIAAFLEQFAHKLKDSHAILRSYWELAEAPESWRPLLARFDEIWAPTEFVARAFRHVYDGPITLVPPMVAAGTDHDFPRARFGLEADRFVYLFTFDYASIAARKNPLGLLAAFRRAFPDAAERVGLVVKATGAPEKDQMTREALAAAARADPRIAIIDETFPRDEILAMIRAADAYVSLHRAEGFGYGMAEALSFARPVIATDYSGSRDFLSEATGYPVPFHLVPVDEDAYPHGQGQVWAEPDIDAAAAIMRHVRGARAERESRAETGRRLIAERFGAGGAQTIAADRLRALLRTRTG